MKPPVTAATPTGADSRHDATDCGHAVARAFARRHRADPCQRIADVRGPFPRKGSRDGPSGTRTQDLGKKAPDRDLGLCGLVSLRPSGTAAGAVGSGVGDVPCRRVVRRSFARRFAETTHFARSAAILRGPRLARRLPARCLTPTTPRWTRLRFAPKCTGEATASGVTANCRCSCLVLVATPQCPPSVPAGPGAVPLGMARHFAVTPLGSRRAMNRSKAPSSVRRNPALQSRERAAMIIVVA